MGFILPQSCVVKQLSLSYFVPIPKHCRAKVIFSPISSAANGGWTPKNVGFSLIHGERFFCRGLKLAVAESITLQPLAKGNHYEN